MKNTILARQKEMHSSLEKVKQLIRLIHGIDLSKPVDSEATVGALSNGPDCTPPANASTSTPAPSPPPPLLWALGLVKSPFPLFGFIVVRV